MKRQHAFIFVVSGLCAGLISVLLGLLDSLIAILALAYGVGPLFFMSVFAGILITGAWRFLKTDPVYYLAGLVICSCSYFLAFVAIFWMGGLSQYLFGFTPASHLEQFGTEVLFGLTAAALVGATGIALFAALLTGKWSKSLLRQLMIAGLATVAVTYLVNLPFDSYWSFFGVLLPLGNGLFCYLVGREIWKHAESRTPLSPPDNSPDGKISPSVF